MTLEFDSWIHLVLTGLVSAECLHETGTDVASGHSYTSMLTNYAPGATLDDPFAFGCDPAVFASNTLPDFSAPIFGFISAFGAEASQRQLVPELWELKAFLAQNSCHKRL